MVLFYQISRMKTASLHLDFEPASPVDGWYAPHDKILA